MKKFKKKGIMSNFVLMVWIPFVLIGTNYMGEVYNSLGITENMVTGVSAVMCLLFLKYQILWSVETDPDDKTLDTQISMLPGLAIVLSVAAVVMTPLSIGANMVFWFTNLVIFCIAFWIDFSAGNQVGNIILNWKSVEQRTS